MSSPSNRLYHNEVSSFPDALRLYVCQYEWENTDAARHDEPPIFGPEKMEEIRAQVKEAHRIYDECIEEAVRRLRAAGLNEFADALESGNYHALAI